MLRSSTGRNSTEATLRNKCSCGLFSLTQYQSHSQTDHVALNPYDLILLYNDYILAAVEIGPVLFNSDK